LARYPGLGVLVLISSFYIAMTDQILDAAMLAEIHEAAAATANSLAKPPAKKRARPRRRHQPKSLTVRLVNPGDACGTVVIDCARLKQGVAAAVTWK